MRIASLIAALGLIGAACAPTYTPERAVYVRAEPGTSAAFDAYTTDGDFVRVIQDQRTGDMIIVDPPTLNGEHVAVVSAHGAMGGAPLVTLRATPARVRVHGSAGDRIEPH